MHDPIKEVNNVARVPRVLRASHVWLHNCPWRQLLCEVSFTCCTALVHALQCMCDGELRATCPSRVSYTLSVTPPWPRGGLRRTACTCPSHVSYALRGLALRVVCGGSALLPRAELPVQHVLSVSQQLCRIFVSLLALCAMPPLYPRQYQLPHTHLTECDAMSCCNLTKDQNAAMLFQVKRQTCMCAMFESLEFHVLPLRVPLVTTHLLCSRVPCRVGLRHGRSVC